MRMALTIFRAKTAIVYRNAAGKLEGVPAVCQNCGNAWLSEGIGGDVYCRECGHLVAEEPLPERPPVKRATEFSIVPLDEPSEKKNKPA